MFPEKQQFDFSKIVDLEYDWVKKPLLRINKCVAKVTKVFKYNKNVIHSLMTPIQFLFVET